MSKFTRPLVVRDLGDGVNLILEKVFTYDIGFEGSLDTLVVQRGFITDLASIPRFLWFLLPKRGRYDNPALVHDFLYWSQERPRVEADKVMLEAMIHYGVAPWKRAAMYRAIRLFGWLAWKRNRLDRQMGHNRVLNLELVDHLDRENVYRRPRLKESLKEAAGSAFRRRARSARSGGPRSR